VLFPSNTICDLSRDFHRHFDLANGFQSVDRQNTFNACGNRATIRKSCLVETDHKVDDEVSGVVMQISQ
jgi:hypothetical protein